MFVNPIFDYFAKFFCFLKKFHRLCIRGRMGAIIIDPVSLTSAGVHIGGKICYGFPHRNLQSLKGRQVMPSAHDAIARTGNDHFGQLKNGIIRRRKSPVRRKRRNAGVLQVPINEVS